MEVLTLHNGRRAGLITIRSPPPGRYNRILKSISKIARAQLVTGTLFPTIHLRMNADTVLAYLALSVKSLKWRGPALMDVVAAPCVLLRGKNSLVVDFRTPFQSELEWLGHGFLASLARTFERTLKSAELAFAANEKMASICKDLGARSVHVIPNYPTRSFRQTTKHEKWKTLHGLTETDRIVLFTGGVRLREIYGLDLLLDCWKLIEATDPSYLVILGDDSLRYIREKINLLKLKHVLLPGMVRVGDVANWINCADVCVAPRTPGFPQRFYDDKDSTKISEYAALRKPIVAAGYASSNQYLLVDQTPEALAEGIFKGLDGKVNLPTPHFWEENEPMMLSLLERFWFN
jgi:hypothetical protein